MNPDSVSVLMTTAHVIWRRTGQRSDPAFIVERHTAISQATHALSSRPGAIYHQQDNASSTYCATSSQQCVFKDMTSYHGLARSPDLSPIEHVWNALGRQLQPSRDTERINCADAKTMAGSSTGGHK
ncbi:hypothetical protein TNCV_2566241 [Trichonephila clavipes]|nr:hypothetical protein TNCV_2566241 [Trichonephila clavipes]